MLYLVVLLIFFSSASTLSKETNSANTPTTSWSSLWSCPSLPSSSRVLRVTVLLPSASPNLTTDADSNAYHNHLEKVLPALHLLNEAPNPTLKTLGQILPGWRLEVQPRDTRCSSTIGPLHAVEMHCRTDLFLGPICPYVLAPVARYGSVWRLPLITTGGQASNFRNREQYPYLTTVGGTYYQLGVFFRHLLAKFSWSTVSFVYHTYPATSGKGRSACQFTLGQVYLELGGKSNGNLSYDGFDDLATDDDMERILRDVSTKARVVVLCGSQPLIRQLMLKASNLGLLDTGSFVFFNVELFGTHHARPWLDSAASAESNLLARSAFESVLTVTTSMSASAVQDANEFETRVHEMALNQLGDKEHNLQDVNYFVAKLYDAVLLYASAFKKVMEEFDVNTARTRGDLVTLAMRNTTFEGVSGRMRMDERGDGSATYALLDLNPSKQVFEVVAIYDGHTHSFDLDNTSRIHWPNRKGPPKDRPECGFQGELCEKDSLDVYIVSGVFSSLMLVLMLFAVIVYRRIKLEADLASMTWKVRPEEVLPVRPGHGSRASLRRTSLMSVDSEGGRNKQVFAVTCMYKGSVVAMKRLGVTRVVLDRDLLLELKRMKDLSHSNVVRFVGAHLEESSKIASNFLLTEYCSRGSLQDLLEDDGLQLDLGLKLSLVQDIVNGMVFLHTQFAAHGNLKSSNCVVDSRLVVKITDFALARLRHNPRDQAEMGHDFWKAKLWTAPELLRVEVAGGSAKGDVYAFAIILHEIVVRQGSFYTQPHLDVKDIIEGVKRGCGAGAACETGSAGSSSSGLVRPTLNPPEDETEEELNRVMERCWSEEPFDRPDFTALKMAIRKLNRDNESSNILDNLLSRMELYANNLEELVAERTSDYLEEKRKCEDLLYELLPKPVAHQLIQGQSVIAETYNSVTIYFSDIVGFTALSAASTPLEVVDFLNDLYTCFDAILGHFDVYKVETIGDAYVVASGLPMRNGNEHARQIARMSLALLNAVRTFRIRHRPEQQLKLRIGMHTGSCCAGVVGVKMPRYCLFGDTVNTASRMESTGLPLKIHVSPQTKEVLDTFHTFDLEYRGPVEMKGKGCVHTYWLLGENGSTTGTTTTTTATTTTTITSTEATASSVSAVLDKKGHVMLNGLPEATLEELQPLNGDINTD